MRIKSLLHPMLAVVTLGAFAPQATYAETPSQLAVAALDTSGATDARPEPERWLPSRGRECNERGRYKNFCAGPRRVPMPFGPEAELAKQLGLGETKTVSHLLLQPAKPDWIEAAGPVFNEDAMWPVPAGKLWRGFGRVDQKRRRGKNHDGIDIGAPVGTPIVAVQDGIVAYADNGIRGYGNFLVTVHGDGTVAFYAHCKSIYVFPGQIISQGQIVAEVGTTGYARGSHLHFEMRNHGRLKDPMKFLIAPLPNNS
jgi:murein DD-endopeptidase MepM/ murein hydrolase activator NlpD